MELRNGHRRIQAAEYNRIGYGTEYAYVDAEKIID